MRVFNIDWIEMEWNGIWNGLFAFYCSKTNQISNGKLAEWRTGKPANSQRLTADTHLIFIMLWNWINSTRRLINGFSIYRLFFCKNWFSPEQLAVLYESISTNNAWISIVMRAGIIPIRKYKKKEFLLSENISWNRIASMADYTIFSAITLDSRLDWAQCSSLSYANFRLFYIWIHFLLNLVFHFCFIHTFHSDRNGFRII